MSAYNQQAINLIYNELSSRGVKPEVAAGVIAGMMGESGAGLDPTAFNTQDPHGGAGGIAQWNNERLIGSGGLLAFAKANGVNVDTNTPTDSKKVPLAIQAKYLGHELDTRYSGVLKGLQVLNNGEEGLTTWVNNFEVPADKTGAINQRRQYIAPVSGLLGKPAPAGSAGASVAGQTPYRPLTPMETAGMSLGETLGNMGGAVGGSGSQIVDPPDPPAIRTPALDENFTAPANPVPAQFAGGVGSQLGSLAMQQPQTQPFDGDPSITPGAPSMTAMLGSVGGGGANVNLTDPRRPPSISPVMNQYSRFSRLG